MTALMYKDGRALGTGAGKTLPGADHEGADAGKAEWSQAAQATAFALRAAAGRDLIGTGGIAVLTGPFACRLVALLPR